MSDTDILIAAIMAMGYTEDRPRSSATDYTSIIAFKPGLRLPASYNAPLFELHCDYTKSETKYHLVEKSKTWPDADSLGLVQQLIEFRKLHNLP